MNSKILNIPSHVPPPPLSPTSHPSSTQPVVDHSPPTHLAMLKAWLIETVGVGEPSVGWVEKTDRATKELPAIICSLAQLGLTDILCSWLQQRFFHVAFAQKLDEIPIFRATGAHLRP